MPPASVTSLFIPKYLVNTYWVLHAVPEEDTVLGPEAHCQTWNQDNKRTVHVVSAIVTSNCQRGSRKALQRSEGPELNPERRFVTKQLCMGAGGSLIRETKLEFAGKGRSNVSF